MANSNDFVHLHVHSRFSIRDGLPSPAKLVDYAKATGFESMALTDHGNMGGHYQFAVAAASTETGDGMSVDPLHAIFGVEAYVCDDILVKESIEIRDENGNLRKRRPKHRHLVLLAKDAVGYKNLLKMIKKASDPSDEGGYYYEPRIDLNLLESHSEGLVCTSACLAGDVSQCVLQEDEAAGKEIADRYRQIFGDDYYLEIQYHGLEDERRCYSGVEAIADDLGIPLVATNDVHYTLKTDAATHSLLVSMRFRKNQKDGGSSDSRNLNEAYVNPEFYLKSAKQMALTFERRPDALHRTREIAEKCRYEFPLSHSIIWPHYDIPEDMVDEVRGFQKKKTPHLNDKQTLLVIRAQNGLTDRGLANRKDYVDRMRMELDSIFDLGYEDYFLVQYDICKWADDAGIAMGPGRGSGAGSLVLFCLGITAIDPIKNGLIFERFLNPGRGPLFDHSLDIPGIQGGLE